MNRRSAASPLLVWLILAAGLACRPASAGGPPTPSGRPEVVIRNVSRAAIASELARRAAELGYEPADTARTGEITFWRAAGVAAKLAALSPGSQTYLHFAILDLVGAKRVLGEKGEVHSTLMVLDTHLDRTSGKDAEELQHLLEQVRDTLESRAPAHADSSETPGAQPRPAEDGIAIVPVGRPGALTAGKLIADHEALWVNLTDGRLLLRLDPSNGAEIGQVALEGAPGAMAIGDSSVWVACADRPVVWEISTATNQVVSTFATPEVLSGLAVGPDAVWAIGLHAAAFRIGIRDHGVHKVELPAVATDIVWAGERPWILLKNGLVQIEPATRSAGPRIKLTGFPLAMASDSSSLWVSISRASLFSLNGMAQFVTRWDARSGKEQLSTSTKGWPRCMAMGGGSLWVGSRRDMNSGGYALSRLDPRTHDVIATREISGMAITNLTWSGQAVWVSTLAGGSLVRFAAASWVSVSH